MGEAFNFDNPLKIVVLLIMVFTWLFWLGQTNTSLNAIGGNTTIAAKFCCAGSSAYGATSWLLWIVLSPFALILFVKWAANHMERDGGMGDIDVGAMAAGSMEEEDHSFMGQARLLHRTRVARRKHHSLSDLYEGLQESDDT